MSSYPKPPFDTTITWFIDSFDPELGAKQVTIDLNELSTEELLSTYGGTDLAKQIIAFRLSAPPEFSFNDIMDFFIFVNPVTYKVEALYLHFHEPQKRINGEWVPVTRETDPDIEYHLEGSLMYKADWKKLFEGLPDLDEDDDSEVRTVLDLAFDDGTITEELVQKYSVLLTSPEGINPTPKGFQ